MSAFPFIPRIPFYRPYYYRSLRPAEVNNFANEQAYLPIKQTQHQPSLHDNSVALPFKNYNSNADSKQSESSKRNNDISDDVIFDIFGIKLHFDDILLICLIFFLYSEGVQDEMLFISLILLLLS